MTVDKIFTDGGTPPDDASLAAALGRAKRSWDALLAHLDEAHRDLRRSWRFYGPRHGWQLKVEAKKRAVLYLIPAEGRFTAALALRDAAIAALPALGVPRDLIREIESGKAFPEGRPARVQVTGAAQLAIVRKLIAAKLA
jgi:UDP-N-acetylmuramyl tripeptide synthase